MFTRLEELAHELGVKPDYLRWWLRDEVERRSDRDGVEDSGRKQAETAQLSRIR